MPMPTCGRATARASGSRASRHWRRNRRATSRPRLQSRAPRSTRRSSRLPAARPHRWSPRRAGRGAPRWARAGGRSQAARGAPREGMTGGLNARRDPAWTADGFVSDRWLPASPVTGRLDAFAWRDPLAGSDYVGTVIEAEKRPVLDERPAQAAEMPPDGAGTASDDQFAATGETHFPPPQAPVQQEPSARRARGVNPLPLAPAVIPLVHAPDDPGPEPEAQIEPEPEPNAAPPSEGWSRIRALFKS